MFLFKNGEPVKQTKSLGHRTRQARSSAYRGVTRCVCGIRGWTAPRLESAAQTLTSSVAPKVSAVLLTTAKRVRPAEPEPARTGLRRFMSWRWLLGIGAGILAAGAAAFTAITVQRRYVDATTKANDAADITAQEETEAVRLYQADGTPVPPQGAPDTYYADR